MKSTTLYLLGATLSVVAHVCAMAGQIDSALTIIQAATSGDNAIPGLNKRLEFLEGRFGKRDGCDAGYGVAAERETVTETVRQTITINAVDAVSLVNATAAAAITETETVTVTFTAPNESLDPGAASRTQAPMPDEGTAGRLVARKFEG